MKELWSRLPLHEQVLWIGAAVVLVLGIGVAVAVSASGGSALALGGAGIVGALVLGGAAFGFRASRLSKVDDLTEVVNKELDKKWKPGLNKVRGFNIYEKPWYILAGDPSTGKTTAIRQAGLPPGIDANGRLLHDPMQGE